ncbi:sugar ABC transporter substrate-binding protein [Clostridium polynesiense]|uniref:sugar ABC transporter substrate-binding protein n=1 Tax=Clostridium polynesiense TaxID=1325933 RepID=UPI00058C0100|nr:sugar ABC transporter substrate-binding protein [Clostridium polynesiense]
MKNKITKLLPIFLAGAVFLGGCSSNTGKKGGAASGDKTITVWAMGTEGELLDKLTPDFEKSNPGMKVDVQAIPWDQAHDKLLTAVASGSGPDVVQMGTSWVTEFADAGVLMDLTDLTKEYKNLNPDNFFESSIKTGYYNDTYVGVPWYVETRVLFYRTDLLAEAGYPEGPKTWKELEEAAKKLSDSGKNKYGILLDTKDQMFSLIFAWQNGAEPLSKDNKPQFNSSKYVEAVDFATGLIKDGYAPAQSDYDAIQGFKDGTFPMFIGGPWMINSINKTAADLEGKWKVKVLPGNTANTSYVGGSNLSIFKSTDNAKEAAAYINYLTEVSTQMKWLETANTLPSRTEAWEQEALKNNELLAPFGEQMKDSKSAPAITSWESIAQELISAMEKITVTGADVKSEMDQVNKKAEELLKQ